MAVIDVVKWDDASPDVFAWKYPSDELSTWTQLVVNESQEAVLVKEGQFIGPFPAGRHTLDTRNYPFLTEILKIGTGGQAPFTAEVWFVNKVVNLDVKWGTSDPIQLQDPQYNLMMPVRAFGQLGMEISDSNYFLQKLVGTLPSFDKSKVIDYFRGVMLTKVKTIVAKKIIDDKIPVLTIATHLESLSDHLKEELVPELAEFGLGLLKFYVHSISVPEDDPAVKKMKEALAAKAEMDIMGTNYTQKRSFDTMETAAGNEGTAGGVMGAGMGMGMGMGVGVPMGNMAGQMAGQMKLDSPSAPCPKCGTPVPQNSRFCNSCGAGVEDSASEASGSKNSIICDKCGTSAAKGSQFCPSCGDPFICCSKCGTDNAEGSVTCRQCGAPMPLTCGKCGSSVDGGVKFCPGCGNEMASKCPRCDTVLQPNAKFCPGCGTNLSEPAEEG